MRRILPILFALACIAGLVWLYRIAQRFDPAAREARAAQHATLSEMSVQFANARVVNRVGGRPEWSVTVQQIEARRPAGGELDQLRSVEFTGIRDGILYRDGRREASFSAKSATYDYFAGRFDVRGAIQVDTARGDSLRAEQLQWSQRDDFLRFPAGASGKLRGHTIKAPWLLYQPKKRIVDCPQGAEGVFNGYPARAANLYWDVGKERVEFRGPVSGERKGITFAAQSGTLDLRSRVLKANKVRMELRIEGESLEEALR